jgi:hypothetical protein
MSSIMIVNYDKSTLIVHTTGVNVIKHFLLNLHYYQCIPMIMLRLS